MSRLVLLYAQHIDSQFVATLANWLRSGQMSLTLVYTTDPGYIRPNSSLEDLAVQQTAPDKVDPRCWPAMPAGHALGLRYRCRLSLSTDMFTAVEAVLLDTFNRLSRWLDTQPTIDQRDLAQAVASVAKCVDAHQLPIRAAGADLALIAARRSTTTRRLGVLGGGGPQPETTAAATAREDRQPRRHERQLSIGGAGHSEAKTITTIEDLLHELLYTDRKRVHHSRVPDDLVNSTQELRSQDILGHDVDGYLSATSVAAYGAFQRVGVPIRSASRSRLVLPKSEALSET